MKKLTLKDLEFQKGEVLTRTQLKNVLGGASGSGGSGVKGSGTGSSASKYKCCPVGQPNSSLCSSCVSVPAGTTASCPTGQAYSC